MLTYHNMELVWDALLQVVGIKTSVALTAHTGFVALVQEENISKNFSGESKKYHWNNKQENIQTHFGG